MAVENHHAISLFSAQPERIFPSGSIPLFPIPVSAGFPSPADSVVEKLLDLNEYCIRNPVSTYFVRVEDSAWGDLGVMEGDILVVDRGLDPANGSLVLVDTEGMRLLMRLNIRKGITELTDNLGSVRRDSEKPNIWGTVTHIIRRVR